MDRSASSGAFDEALQDRLIPFGCPPGVVAGPPVDPAGSVGHRAPDGEALSLGLPSYEAGAGAFTVPGGVRTYR